MRWRSGEMWASAPAGIAHIILAVSILAVHHQVVQAHDARPLSVEIVGRQDNTYRADIRVPPSLDAGNQPELTWPDGCAVRSTLRQDADGTGLKTILVTCQTNLEG